MTNRRAFLRGLAGAAGLALLPDAVRAASLAATGAAADPVAAFDAAAARWPWLLATKGTGRDLDCESLAIEGRWPRDLRGRYWRNGPALFERGGQRHGHWFDGDGMVQRFTLADGRVAHRGRLVRTRKLVEDAAAGAFRTPAFGLAGRPDALVRGPDDVNVANTSVIEHGGRVLALWEGGSAHALDAATVDTVGPVTWQDGWEQVPFSAHPKLDPQGTLWNFGSAGELAFFYEVGPDGRLVRGQAGRFGVPAGMAHDFAVTERYFVVPLPPVALDIGAVTRGEPAERAFPWNPAEPLRIWVGEKADVSRSRVFELPAEVVFHVGNAYERDARTIVLSYVGSANNGFLQDDARRVIRGDLVERGGHHADAWQLELDLANGTVRRTPLLSRTEFPRVHPHRVGRAARQLLAPAAWRDHEGRPGYWFHGLALLDVESGRLQRYDYGRDCAVEEHLLVPKPGGRDELDAWVLGTSFDARARVTQLAVFEARALADGPLAVARLPYALPLGFHGNFAAA